MKKLTKASSSVDSENSNAFFDNNFKRKKGARRDMSVTNNGEKDKKKQNTMISQLSIVLGFEFLQLIHSSSHH